LESPHDEGVERRARHVRQGADRFSVTVVPRAGVDAIAFPRRAGPATVADCGEAVAAAFADHQAGQQRALGRTGFAGLGPPLSDGTLRRVLERISAPLTFAGPLVWPTVSSSIWDDWRFPRSGYPIHFCCASSLATKPATLYSCDV
jgi:hypothetical protein